MTPGLPWQEPLRARLQGLVEARALPHAMLLSAIAGWGEGVLARWLALTLLGEDTAKEPTELAHPDLRWVVPDGAEIKVEAVRGLAGFAYATPQRGAAKVIVFEDAHLLNRAAANALLKTLEEPPSGTYLLLSTCFPGRLLATVRSRCQRFHVDPDPQAARQWLAAQAGSGGADLDARLYANGGAPLAVVDELDEGTPPLVAVLGEVLDSPRPLAKLDDLLVRDAARLTGGWYRYLLGQLSGGAHFPALERVSARALLAFSDELLWVRAQLLGTNSANARLLLGRLTSRWHQLGTGIS